MSAQQSVQTDTTQTAAITSVPVAIMTASPVQTTITVLHAIKQQTTESWTAILQDVSQLMDISTLEIQFAYSVLPNVQLASTQLFAPHAQKGTILEEITPVFINA